MHSHRIRIHFSQSCRIRIRFLRSRRIRIAFAFEDECEFTSLVSRSVLRALSISEVRFLLAPRAKEKRQFSTQK